MPGTYLLLDHAIFRTHKGLAGELVAVGGEVPEIFESIKFDDVRGSATGH